MDGKSNYPDRKDGKISLRAKKDRSQVIPNYCVIGTTITEIHPPLASILWYHYHYTKLHIIH